MSKFLSLALLCILFNNCKKDNPAPAIPKAYTYITLSDVKAVEGEMVSDQDIQFVNPGTVILYKTNKNIYGKLRITDVDLPNKKFSLEIVNYNTDGSELFVKNTEVAINIESADFDLDMGLKTNFGEVASDFRWYQIGAIYFLRPMHSAVFYLYSN